MTTGDEQTRLVSLEHEVETYERLVTLHLKRLTTWTYLPDERTDWELEQVLQDLGTTAMALRRLRGDAEVPF